MEEIPSKMNRYKRVKEEFFYKKFLSKWIQNLFLWNWFSQKGLSYIGEIFTSTLRMITEKSNLQGTWIFASRHPTRPKFETYCILEQFLYIQGHWLPKRLWRCKGQSEIRVVWGGQAIFVGFLYCFIFHAFFCRFHLILSFFPLKSIKIWPTNVTESAEKLTRARNLLWLIEKIT